MRWIHTIDRNFISMWDFYSQLHGAIRLDMRFKYPCLSGWVGWNNTFSLRKRLCRRPFGSMVEKPWLFRARDKPEKRHCSNGYSTKFHMCYGWMLMKRIPGPLSKTAHEIGYRKPLGKLLNRRTNQSTSLSSLVGKFLVLAHAGSAGNWLYRRTGWEAFYVGIQVES